MLDRNWVSGIWALAASLAITATLRGADGYLAEFAVAAIYVLLAIVTALLAEFRIAALVAVLGSIGFLILPARPHAHRWIQAVFVFGISLLAAKLALLVRERLVRGEVYSCWQQVIERAAWGAAIEDPEKHVFRNVNLAFARMHGYKIEELIGQPCVNVIAPESRGEVSVHARIVQQNCHHVFEATHIRRDGSRFPVMTDVTVYTDAANDVSFLAATYQNITDRHRMEESLRHTRNELEKRVEQRTAALHRVSRRLQRVQDEERRKFARELHDSTGQHLVGLKMNLEMLRINDSATRRENILKDSLQITDLCIGEVRTLSYLLHPPLLDEMGLTSAIRWFVDGFSSRSGIAVNVHINADLTDLATETELVLFRVIQECLTNIHRHSGSKTAEIVLTRTDHQVTLDVRDFGHGISRARIDRHLNPISPTTVGLPGVRERISELEGRMEIVSGPHGTTIRATLPTQTPEHPGNALHNR